MIASGTWFAPGRANLMGEHTDYNEGFVLPFALGQGVAATAAAREDRVLVLRSRQLPGEPATVPLDSLAPGAVTGWAAYPAGVAWALRAAGYDIAGASVDIDSDLPVGAGVSSSAALECAVGLALCELSGLPARRRELALLCKRAENEFVGAPTGIIDQFAALLCQPGHAMLLDCETLSVTQVPFQPSAAGVAALVIDTRVSHALVSGEYAWRRIECEDAARRLRVRALGSVTDLGRLREIEDPVLRRRARHVVTDSARARAIATALRERAAAPGSWPAPGPGRGHEPSQDSAEIYRYVGTLLTEAHASLRDDFEVSWPQADVTVDAVTEAGGYGARMIGGGFGGSVLALVPAARLAAVRAAVGAAFARRAWISPGFLEAVPSAAARRVG